MDYVEVNINNWEVFEKKLQNNWKELLFEHLGVIFISDDDDLYLATNSGVEYFEFDVTKEFVEKYSENVEINNLQQLEELILSSKAYHTIKEDTIGTIKKSELFCRIFYQWILPSREISANNINEDENQFIPGYTVYNLSFDHGNNQIEFSFCFEGNYYGIVEEAADKTFDDVFKEIYQSLYECNLTEDGKYYSDAVFITTDIKYSIPKMYKEVEQLGKYAISLF